MHDIIAQVLSYVWGAWRHRWIALLVAWCVAVGGWIWVWQLPESYIASARVYVDTNSILRPLLRGMAIQPNADQRVAMLSRTLFSRPNLEKLMRMTDLDLEVRTDRQKQGMINRLKRSISLGASRGNNSMYSLRVRHSDRATARRIAQAMLTVFIEGSLGDKRDFTSGAQSFLNEQIKQHEARMVEAEMRLTEFRRENMGMLPGSAGGYYGRLQQAIAELEQARLQLSEMENRRDNLQRQLDGEIPLMDYGTVLDSRIDTLRSRLDLLLTKYTEKHPEIRQIRALIADLEAEKEMKHTMRLEAGSLANSGLNASPIYQDIRSLMTETEAEVAKLQVRVTEYESRVEELESNLNEALDIEARYKQMDRDYGTIAGRYKQLLASRETAQMTEDVEQTASDLAFRVIDPVYVPTKPTYPNKELLNMQVMLGALVAGAGVALLVSLIAPVIVDPRTLSNVTGLPLLGTVTLTLQPEEKRREYFALAAFAILTIGLLVTYLGLGSVQDILFS